MNRPRCDNTGAERLAAELRQLLADLRKATDKDFSLGLMRVRVKHLCDLLPDAEQDLR